MKDLGLSDAQAELVQKMIDGQLLYSIVEEDDVERFYLEDGSVGESERVNSRTVKALLEKSVLIAEAGAFINLNYDLLELPKSVEILHSHIQMGKKSSEELDRKHGKLNILQKFCISIVVAVMIYLAIQALSS